MTKPRTIEVWESVDFTRFGPRAQTLWYVTAEGGNRRVAIIAACETEALARSLAATYGPRYLAEETEVRCA